jgi:hypothetical protein
MNSKSTEVWNIINNVLKKCKQKYQFFTQEMVSSTASITLYSSYNFKDEITLTLKKYTLLM